MPVYFAPHAVHKRPVTSAQHQVSLPAACVDYRTSYAAIGTDQYGYLIPSRRQPVQTVYASVSEQAPVSARDVDRLAVRMPTLLTS